MRLRPCALLALLLGTSLSNPGWSEAQEYPAVNPQAASFWRAAAGLVAINGLTWSYNWYVQRWHWANVGTRAWWKNVQDGFAWDDDAFMVNQLAHPYHGSLYFNAARGAGYGFWSSSVFTAAGSLTWEFLTENVRPSLNDLINTTLGGIALGEVTSRLSSALTGNGTGDVSMGRKAGAFFLNPVGRAQRLWGDSARSGPSGHFSNRTSISVGRFAGTEGYTGSQGPSGSFVRVSVAYGSPFFMEHVRPYDVFEFDLQLSPNNRGVINHVAVSGLLARHSLRESARSQWLLGVYQHYDYDELPTFRVGSQSLGGALLFRHNLSPGRDLSFALQLEGIPLGAVSSDHDGIRNRDYDYGFGGGARFSASFQHTGRELVRFDGRTTWIHSVYGADADHIAATAQLSAMVPLLRDFGVGGDVGLMLRRSVYRDQPRVLRRVPQLRAYLLWAPS